MRVRSRDCRISGLCLTWEKFIDDDRRRVRFAENAFSRWLMESDGCFFLKLTVDHRKDMTLARKGLTSLRWTPEGLNLTARLDTENPTTRLAVMAIQHGWLRHMSTTVATSRPVQVRDAIGRLDLITSARVLEVCATSRPLIPGTTLSVFGHPAPSVPTLPFKSEDREALQAFLSRIGIDATPPKPPEPPKRELTVREAYVKEQLAWFDSTFDDEPQQQTPDYRPVSKPTVKTVNSDSQRVHGVPAGFWI